MIKKHFYLSLLLLAAALHTSAQQRYLGGDISLLTKYEQNGANYMDMQGQKITDVLDYLKQQGMNAMRVRLFVNPANGTDRAACQDLAYVKQLGKHIKDAGLSLMLDFHYSDTWADPAAQWTPKEWETLTDDQLYTKIYDYTKDCLQQLTAAGATPDFIQTGNEISYGMLWGKQGSSNLKKCYTSSTANWPRFIKLLQQAGKACREVCPKAQIVIHTERVGNTGVLTDFYAKMKEVDYDVIGLSYYPYFHGFLPQLKKALSLLESEFADKQVMVVEAGFYHKWQTADAKYDYSKARPQSFAISHEGQRAFTEALIAQLKQHKSVNGLFWWWPEANEYGLDWKTKRVSEDWYNAGLFDNETGRALPALYCLKDFLGDLSGISTVDVPATPAVWHNLQGQQLPSQPTRPGLYFIGRRKVLKSR